MRFGSWELSRIARPEDTPTSGGSSARQRPTIAVQAWHIAVLIFKGARNNQIPRMAAALTYRTLFGLIPVILVSMVMLVAFSSDETRAFAIKQTLHFIGLDQITTGETEYEMSPAPDESGVIPAAPAKAARLDQWIENMVSHAGKVRIQVGLVSLIGAATLVYGAISLLIEIERAFNHIFMAPLGRAWMRRLIQYWALLTLGTVLMVTTFYVSERVLAFASNLDALDAVGSFRAPLIRAFGWLITVIISTMLLFVVYMTMPNTRVVWRPALIGAIVAAVLWETGKWGFRTYVGYSATYSRLYGSLALLPLFMLWMYLTWMIILMGLQIAHSLQTYALAKGAGLTRTVLATLGLIADTAMARKQAVVDPAAILVVMVQVAERFRDGHGSDHAKIAERTSLDERVVAEMLERLAGAGLLHRLSSGSEEGLYALAKPAEQISACEVLEVGERLSSFDLERTPRLLMELHAARIEALKGKTVAELMTPARVPQDGTAAISTSRERGEPSTVSGGSAPKPASA